MKIRCLGAVRTVTGSCFQLENPAGGLTLLDCGLFQGGRQTELRNFNTALYRPQEVRSIVVTHAHMDHSGLIPRLVKAGYRGPVYATAATAELLKILWADGANIQEHEAVWKSRKNSRQGREHVEPLYDLEAAEQAALLLKPLPLRDPVKIAPGLTARLCTAGHILGAVSVHLTAEKDGRTVRALFSGDLGRPGQLLIEDPETPPEADAIFMETTYGNRLHKDARDSVEELLGVIRAAYVEGGKVLIPAFAVERTQELLVLLAEAWHDGRIPRDMPVYLDSPLALAASEIYLRHPELYDRETRSLVAARRTPLDMSSLRISRTSEESRRINLADGPAVVLAGSGMANAGRILHHLKHNLWKANCHVVFVGFQAQGTTGRRLVDGADTVKIFREAVSVGATVHTIGGFSGHADQKELLDWLRPQVRPGLPVYLIHGEETGTLAFAEKIKAVFPELRPIVPSWLETLEIGREAPAAAPALAPAPEQPEERPAGLPEVTEAASFKRRLERLYAGLSSRPLPPDRLARLESLLNRAEELLLEP
ncbi:MAG: MBL fold metallo-hydrolase [Deltaproteobacteria bacterium]|jgi:metallo-beta-lactamase family protein|nr:MBL fold metallo-hydrolase [Deltaproteobacteria bacterium]